MKITTNTVVLNAIIAKVKVACAGPKCPLPILSDILFTKVDGDYWLVGATQDRTLQMRIVYTNVEGDWFDFCLPTETIPNALSLLPDQPITMEVTKNNQGEADSIHFVGSNSDGKETKFDSYVHDAEAYPRPGKVSYNGSVKLSGSYFAACIKEAAKYVANDELRPVMNGVYLDVFPNRVTYVGTDGHKLYRNIIKQEEPVLKEDEHLSADIMKDNINIIASLAGREEEVNFSFSEQILMVEVPDAIYMCRLIDGRYPNYNAVIPTNNPCTVKLNTKDLQRAVKFALNFASESSQLIRLQFEPMFCMVSAEDIDFSQSANEVVTVVEQDGIPNNKLSIGLKGTTLLSCLSDIQTENVVFHLADPSRAVVFSEDDADSGLTLLAMPMLLND